MRRGFTLVEMLVTSALVLMFFGLLYGLFFPVLGVASAGTAKTDTLVAASTALTQLEADVRVSTTNGMTVGATPATPQPSLGSSAETQVMAFEVPEIFANVNDNFGQFQYDATSGLSNFASYVVWQLVPQQNGGVCSSGDPCDLYRTTYNTGTLNTAANPIGATTLANITANIQTNGRLMARNITSFQLANLTVSCSGCLYPTARPELLVELAVHSQDNSGNWSQTSFVTQVFDRNN